VLTTGQFANSPRSAAIRSRRRAHERRDSVMAKIPQPAQKVTVSERKTTIGRAHRSVPKFRNVIEKPADLKRRPRGFAPKGLSGDSKTDPLRTCTDPHSCHAFVLSVLAAFF
jgi:hypothetical protein